MSRKAALRLSMALTAVVTVAVMVMSARAGFFGIGGGSNPLAAATDIVTGSQDSGQQAAVSNTGETNTRDPEVKYVTDYIYYEDGTRVPVTADGSSPGQDESGPAQIVDTDPDEPGIQPPERTTPPRSGGATPAPGRATATPAPGRKPMATPLPVTTPAPGQRTATPAPRTATPKPAPTQEPDDDDNPRPPVAPTATPAPLPQPVAPVVTPTPYRPPETPEPEGHNEPRETARPTVTPEPHDEGERQETPRPTVTREPRESVTPEPRETPEPRDRDDHD
jgi:hypothetical protein